MTRCSFTYGDEQFAYEVCFVPDRREKIAIHVHPDASIQVDAPSDEDPEKIHRAVLKRARWIKHHVAQARAQRAHVLPRSYVSGESHLYLGRRYQLKVNGKSAATPGVKLLRGRICIDVADKDPGQVRDYLWAWYRERAAQIFQRRLEDIVDRVVWLDQVPSWRMVTMQKQWGSCSPKGVILLNPHLVKAPRQCVDYVITHELCHLCEHNHSPRYYRLLSQIMPGWESVKGRLDGMAELILNR